MKSPFLSVSKLSLGLLFVSAIAVSCKKGDTGPAGPAGPTGAVGAAGAAGPQGNPGTANVIYSAWAGATGITDSTIDGSIMKVGHIKATAITSSILNSGTVLTYMTYGSGVFPLPFTSNAGSKTSTISYIPRVGVITVTRFTHDNTNSVNLPGSLQFRYIVIPGGVAPNAVDELKKMSYKEVTAKFNVPMY